MKDFIAPQWREILTKHGFADFKSFWDLELTPLDTPNFGRGPGGWSSVCILPVISPEGHEKKLILKRQNNHTSRTLLHPFHGIPTFKKEVYNIILYKRLGIPTVDLVYYAMRKRAGAQQAILLTEYLDGYVSLDKFVTHREERLRLNRDECRGLISAIAELVRNLHSRGLQHNSLYPKHIFLRRENHEFIVKLIDLEKNIRRPFGYRRNVRDLESLSRHARGWSQSDRIHFLKSYCGVKRLDGKTKTLCRRISKRNVIKSQRN